MRCRHCDFDLTEPFIDLGSAPPSNAYLSREALARPEKWYPLRVYVCSKCWLVQTEDFAGRGELFDSHYAYFSSYSTTWLAHAEAYVGKMAARFSLSTESVVVEIAANDGYLLQYVKARGIPCYGVEPTASTAAAAKNRNLDIIEEFFGVQLARRLTVAGRPADLMVANNVLAHVPDINDFVTGFALLLKPNGVATFEFPHALNLIEKRQFDTIYHEHYSYLSLLAVEGVFKTNGLRIFDVEEIPTHGGSLRIFAQRADTGKHAVLDRLDALRKKELQAGICSRSFYADFQKKAVRIKNDLLAFLIDAGQKGRKVAAYGAAAKGNTLLNYAGVRPDLLPYVADKSPAKQGQWLPGSRIPIVSEDHLRNNRPDDILILPWNIRDEILEQLAYARAWGARFVIAVPKLELIE
ncbi:MAG: class I SAM-dependent methyltransferase [Verrucomicrobiae bacterium]|nr:class I SAM-dependent methyltransferase [Verrucomicrobiae bacterium]